MIGATLSRDVGTWQALGALIYPDDSCAGTVALDPDAHPAVRTDWTQEAAGADGVHHNAAAFAVDHSEFHYS